MRRPLILYLLLVVVLIGGGLFWYHILVPEPVPGPPARSAAELAAMSDDRLGGAVAMELSRQIYHGERPQKAGWRRLEPPARAVWVVADCESRLSGPGIDLFAVAQGLRAGADFPDFTEVQAGCQELGLEAAASRMDELNRLLTDHPDPGPAERRTMSRMQASWLAEVGSQAARRKRLAYIRQHLDGLAAP